MSYYLSCPKCGGELEIIGETGITPSELILECKDCKRKFVERVYLESFEGSGLE